MVGGSGGAETRGMYGIVDGGDGWAMGVGVGKLVEAFGKGKAWPLGKVGGMGAGMNARRVGGRR